MKPTNTLLSLKPIGIAAIGIAIIAVAVYVFVNWLPNQQRISQIDSVLADSGQIQAVEEYEPRLVSEPVISELTHNGRKVKVKTETFEAADSADSLTNLGRNDNILWPGNLIRGDGISSYIYRPIALQRAPITLSVNMEGSLGTGGPLSITISDPKLSSVRQGINDLLKGVFRENTTVPAKALFQYSEINNEFDLSVAVGADVKYSTVDLKSKFDFSSSGKSTKLFAKYQQIYYTVDVDAPGTPIDLFSPSLSAEQIANATPPGSMPVYVSSVDYGMMAFIFIESSSSATELNAVLNVVANQIGQGAEVNLDASQSAVFNNSTINIVVYGGSTTELSEVAGGYEGFLKIVSSSTNFSATSPAVPLAYKFTNVSDNTIAAVNLTSQYTTVTEMWGQPVQISITKLECRECEDDEDYFGWIGSHQLEFADFTITAEILTPAETGVYEGVIFSTGPGYKITHGETHLSQNFNAESASPTTLEAAIGTRDFDPKDYKLKISWLGTESDTVKLNTNDGFNGDQTHGNIFNSLPETREFSQYITLVQDFSNFTILATIKVEFPDEE